ncbi:hypothetical protein DLJ49_16320 [Rhodovulum sp. 12E13]|uniref:hypothetical protein n=1 Tax=Rhodovulum sp. 12E13 TaxID=2203891 RepID=UPI000E1B1210|nr:hypothetical protein [Rhodovulum sp. 12E13]RDC71092.1 hypothetical protein DLJ49_16320 [Rhodovulum sp. 12E13]
MSDDIIRLAENLIGPADRRRLESYGAHVIQHGWATRYAWSEEDGDPRFDIFRGGPNEECAVRVGRHREADEFFAEDAAGQQITAGPLDHVMAELDIYLEQRSGHAPHGA